MSELITLPVIYKGEPVDLEGKVIAFGYTYKLSFGINGIEVLFEPDEDRNYRAILANPEAGDGRKVDQEMIKAILDTLAEMRKA